MSHKVVEHTVLVELLPNGQLVALEDSRPALIEVAPETGEACAPIADMRALLLGLGTGEQDQPFEGMWIIHLCDPDGAVVARRRRTLAADSVAVEFSAAELFPAIQIGTGYRLSIRSPDGRTHHWPADAGPWRSLLVRARDLSVPATPPPDDPASR